MAKEYSPSQEILDKYANLLVKFALSGGKGIKKNQSIFLQIPESAKPMLISLQKAIINSGGNIILQYLPDDISKDFYNRANSEQLDFFPRNFIKGRVQDMDHLISIIAEKDKHELEGIDPKKIMRRSKAFKPYMDWRDKKENQGKFTWTLALFATEAMAKEAGISLKEYWQQIIKGCYLNEKDPVKKWKDIFLELSRLKNKLNNLNIKEVQIISKGTNLKIGLGEKRKWLAGSGRNIPSFEVFTSPDWRTVNGHITLNQPLYRYGNIVKDIYLEFKDGEVIKAKAKSGEKFLKEMIATDEGSKRVGEFSLTDIRLSKIDKFMAETLFDENFGGKYGNTHIALGHAYKESFSGNLKKLSKKQANSFGFNDSIVHTDVISTENRTVYATLKNGKKIVLYKDGKFLI